ncbi:MAG: right-handed parallel beta-helix repeat-containing protein [candidate division Zixibacteria bacterium]|nr:right-handed parallel beta-helix repeat-containing protein [candidate division Zixibacteria bacterium]
MKNELSVRYPTNYLDTLANLTINSILLHYGTKIDSQIAIDFLVLDDDDSDLENGTPHSTEILAAFGAHNLGYSAPNAIWVDSATGDNETGDGSENSPYASIQKGIDAAYSGDTVYVGPGTYTELVNFHGKPIPVLSTQGPLFTRITGGPSANLVNFNSNEDSTSIFEGFTIEGGSIGIKIRHSGPTIRGNVLIGQLSAGIDVYDDLVTDINELPNIHNNTIVYGASSGIVVYTLPGFPLNFKNNIVAFCGGAGISLFDPPWSEISSEQPLVTYNDVYGNNPDYDLVTPGTGSISSDPLFCDLSRLSVLSPCIDAGDPNPSYNDPDGSRNDIGAIPFFVDSILLVPSEFSTIQAAINRSCDGEIILVDSGTYQETDIDFLGKAIVVKAVHESWKTTITSPTGNGSLVLFRNGEDSNSVLDGFTLLGADNGVDCYNAAPTITRCIFKNQTPDIDHGALNLWGATVNSVGNSPARIINCNFVGSSRTGIMDRSYEPPIIKNTIVYDNNEYGVRFWTDTNDPLDQPLLSYNCVNANGTDYSTAIQDSGVGSIHVDPLLYSGGWLNFLSPCIDAGDPDSIYNDPDGSRNDIGAVPFFLPDSLLVPSEFSTIQAAINMSIDGDVVLVDSGTYQENNIDFLGKAITVKGVGSPWATTITTNVQGTLVLFRNDEDSNSVLDGFRLLGGGMAVICYNAGPTIIRCLFKDQVPSGNEGALNLWGATYNSVGTSPAKIINCTFMGSSRSGIVDRSWEPPVIKNVIVYNHVEYGINWDTYLNKPSEAPELSYNCVNGNGTDYGGGITDSGIGSLHINPNLTPGGSLWLLSTVIDLGDPDSIYNDPDGSRNDMGAWPYQEPGEPPPPPRKPELEEGELPKEFALFQNYPNPFNPATVISFSLPVASEYELTIYNILGQEVKTFSGHSESGTVDIHWDASAYGSGIYLYKLTAGTYTATKKMIVLK